VSRELTPRRETRAVGPPRMFAPRREQLLGPPTQHLPEPEDILMAHERGEAAVRSMEFGLTVKIAGIAMGCYALWRMLRGERIPPKLPGGRHVA